MSRRSLNYLSEALVMDLLDRLEAYQTAYIDGKILAGATRMAYFCGLTKKEIVALKVGDVAIEDGHISDVVASCRKVIIPEPVKAILREHLLYLRNNEYDLSPAAPLFPQKDGHFYNERNWSRHRDKVNLSGRLGGIRKAGFFRTYIALREQGGIDKETIYAKVAKYARVSKKWLIKVISPPRPRNDEDNED
jgi:integrase